MTQQLNYPTPPVVTIDAAQSENAEKVSMTSIELRAWIKRQGLSHQAAAQILALSLDGLRNNLYGRRPIGAQTARIIELFDRQNACVQ
jgi:hypothetical protein